MNPQQALVLLYKIYPKVSKKQELINRKHELETKRDPLISFSNKSGIGMFIIFIILPFAIIPFLFYKMSKLVVHRSKRGNQPEINEINARIAKINTALDKYDFLPQDYKTEEAVYFMIKYFENGRVDSLKEAMNLFESERFSRQNVESQRTIIKNQNTVIRNQERHESLLRRIKHNTYYN